MTERGIEILVNSDYASDNIDRGSFSGYIVMLTEDAISYSNKEKPTALSTIKVKYLSMLKKFTKLSRKIDGGPLKKLRNCFCHHNNAFSHTAKSVWQFFNKK